MSEEAFSAPPEGMVPLHFSFSAQFRSRPQPEALVLQNMALFAFSEGKARSFSLILARSRSKPT
jgi:hypothetical protein